MDAELVEEERYRRRLSGDLATLSFEGDGVWFNVRLRKGTRPGWYEATWYRYDRPQREYPKDVLARGWIAEQRGRRKAVDTAKTAAMGA